MHHPRIVHLILRISIASVFLYAAVAATLQPFNWIGYIPPFFSALASIDTLLKGFSLVQFLLSVWILTGWKSFWAAIVSAVLLLAIITANFGDIDILFRDFAIFFAAVALAIGSWEK